MNLSSNSFRVSQKSLKEMNMYLWMEFIREMCLFLDWDDVAYAQMCL